MKSSTVSVSVLKACHIVAKGDDTAKPRKKGDTLEMDRVDAEYLQAVKKVKVVEASAAKSSK